MSVEDLKKLAQQVHQDFISTEELTQRLEEAIAELYRAADSLVSAACEIEAWRSAAIYDTTMEGPKFKHWDYSQLDRCRHLYIESTPDKVV